jgi:hypothetical protein
MWLRSTTAISYKRDAAGTLGLSCLQKVAATFHMIPNSVAANATDEYVRVGESTALECLRKFVIAIAEVFGPKYLRLPNEHDTLGLLALRHLLNQCQKHHNRHQTAWWCQPELAQVR